MGEGGGPPQIGGGGGGLSPLSVTGLSLENGGCVGEPHIVVERCLVFLCILHGRMATRTTPGPCNAYYTGHARV